MRILALSGSLQARSANIALLEVARANAPPGVEVIIFDGLRHLPQFDLDLEANAPLPVVEEWRRALAGSDAVLIASPEYGFSLPGALKNGIDWVIGSAELERKLIAVTASVNHPERGRRGLAALLEPLQAVSARIVGGEPIVRGASFERDVAELLAKLVRAVHVERTGAL
jgi:NAD(P)H-dependent FMN reductase